MKVLHVLCDLSGGGAERLVLAMCQRAAPDVDAEVAVLHRGGALVDAFRDAGVRVHCVDRTRGQPGGRAFLRLARLAREADVVHTHLWAGDAWGRPAAWLARVPVRVSTEHNTDVDEGWLKTRWKARTAHLCHRIVAVSEPVAAWWRARGVPTDRLVVIPNGVDLERFASVPSENMEPATHTARPLRVLAVGRLVPQKGFDVLMRAMHLLPNAELELVGEGPERARLQALAPPTARLVGASSDVPAHMARADVLAIPSRWEGFGLVAAEGLAAGLPVVASSVGGLPEVLGEAGLLVPPEDPPALADALQRLRDPAQRRHLAHLGRHRAPHFGLNRMIRAYENLYRELQSAQSGSRAPR